MSLDKTAWISIFSLLQRDHQKSTPVYEVQRLIMEHYCIHDKKTTDEFYPAGLIYCVFF